MNNTRKAVLQLLRRRFRNEFIIVDRYNGGVLDTLVLFKKLPKNAKNRKARQRRRKFEYVISFPNNDDYVYIMACGWFHIGKFDINDPEFPQNIHIPCNNSGRPIVGVDSGFGQDFSTILMHLFAK